jgi:hypothetical protein
MLNRQKWAPYAPPATVLSVLRHYRERDVPETITGPDLAKAGVKRGLWPRTLAALKFLRLIEEDGLTTRRFRELREATSAAYPTVLASILRTAYQPVFSGLDPSTANDSGLRSAFHPYSPGGQRSRMITLFRGLCQEADIAISTAPQSGPRGGRPPRASLASQSTGVKRSGPSFNRRSSLWGVVDDVDPAIVTWVSKLPAPGSSWPALARKRWVEVLGAILDTVYPETGSQEANKAGG